MARAFHSPGELTPDQHYVGCDRRDPSIEAYEQIMREPVCERYAPLGWSKLLNALADLTNRDHAEVDSIWIESIDPIDYLLGGLLGYQLRDNIGVEQVVHSAMSGRSPL